MPSNIVTIVESGDCIKDTMNVMMDFLSYSRFSDSDTEEMPHYLFRAQREFMTVNVALNTVDYGQANELYVTDNRVPLEEKFNDIEHDKLVIKFKDVINKVKEDNVDFVSVAVTTEPIKIKFEKENENITSFLEIVYSLNGNIYRLSNDSPVSKVYQTYIYIFSTKPFPGTVFLTNPDFVSINGVYSDFEIPVTDSVANTIVTYSNPIKYNMFIPTITSKIEGRVGNYKVITKEDVFSFTIFGNQKEIITISDNEQRIFAHKAFVHDVFESIDVNKLVTLKSKYPSSISKTGEVTLDISDLAPGESTYVAAYIDMGDFFNNHVVETEKAYFEYVVYKDSEENITVDKSNKEIVLL